MFWEVQGGVHWGTEVGELVERSEERAQLEVVEEENYCQPLVGRSRTPCWEISVPGTAGGHCWRAERRG